MKPEQILGKAIVKACTNGYELVFPYTQNMHEGVGGKKGRWFFADCTPEIALLVDHDFAKALWGEEDEHMDVEVINPEIGGHYDRQEQPPLPAYKKHLAQMAIADDPIKYLEEHLE